MTHAVNPTEDFLRLAIDMARDNVQSGRGGPFGAIVVADNHIIGRGTNLVTATKDPTAHAEVVAIRDACQGRQHFALADCEIYTSCEPCPLCLAAIYWARIKCIHYAATADDAAAAGFDDRIFYHELAKPPAERQVPMLQGLSDEAQAPFQLWRASPQRIDY